MSKKQLRRKYLKWNAPVLLMQSGIRRKDRLAEVMNELGVDISSTQIGRIVNDRPKRVSMEVLEGLCSAFDCTPSELMVLVDNKEAIDEPDYEVVTNNHSARQSGAKRGTGSHNAKNPNLPPDPPGFD